MTVASLLLRIVAAVVAVTLVMLAAPVTAADTSPGQRLASDETFRTTVLPMVRKYCLDCHGEDGAEGDLSFHDLDNPQQILDDRATWEKAFKQLGIEGMPPRDHDERPTRQENRALVEWLELKLYHCDCSVVDDVGRPTIRRLNRTEYNNTVRDLLGVDIHPADDFPADDVGYGFSNIGDVLSLPPLLLEKYVDAAEKIAAATIITDASGRRSQRFAGDQLTGVGGIGSNDGLWLMYSSGSVQRDVDVATAGNYVIRVEAQADQAGPELAKMQVKVDGRPVRVHEVKGERLAATYDVAHRFTQGRHRIEAGFINDYYRPEAKDPRDRDRNLAVGYLELQGPTDGPPPEAHQRIVFTRPSDGKSVEHAAREVLARLMPRAFRRPLQAAELDRMVGLVKLAVERDDSFERGIQVALQAVLVSPHFLFRVELDPDPDNPGAKHSINDFELASRLSYFLWSTMPDEVLLRLAAEGKLHEKDVLDQQVTRMLKDPRADALVENFASQWLNLGNLAEVVPDPQLFPAFSPELRADMIRETELFARTIFREDRSLLEFLDADFTHANQRLAKHYGIDGVAGGEFRRVKLPAGQRSGVLTHGSILTLTSNPDRTSLVRRGVWILDNILGARLPDPPADVPSLEEGAKESGAMTLRDQLKLHREKGACASCHDTMDPLGFGFENFDAIGRWRDRAEGRPIDAGGTLPGGRTFSGPVELAQLLKERKREFAQLLTAKMLTYALGRGLELPDSCTVDAVVADLEENDYRFTVLVRGIVHSKPFLMRRGDAGGKR